MSAYSIPTSANISLEIDSKRIAVVQNYRVVSKSKCLSIGEFGSNVPVGVVHGPMEHTVTLCRVYATDETISDGIRFHDMDDFSMVISKPDGTIVFTGCQWVSISESAEIGSTVLEEVTFIATTREEYVK